MIPQKRVCEEATKASEIKIAMTIKKVASTMR